ncbi:MAG: DUF6398 domain-containing protein [Candidatus Latescibacter sp.]|nr:DUF6398 domain-containing protein [Candidatus Latescibacter sp.]
MKIKELIRDFCEQHLNDEYEGYAQKLCDKLGRKKKLTITRGREEIWAASIIYVIARLNFLFDRDQEYCMKTDTICDYFGVKKSTVVNKAAQIEKACKLGLGEEGFCRQEITDMFTFVEFPGGIIMPKSALSKLDLEVEFVEGKEAEELEKYLTEQQRIREQEALEKKALRAEINQKNAEEKKKNRQKNQLSLFDDSKK